MKICNIMSSINDVIKIIKKEKIDNKFCFVDSLLLQLFKKRNISLSNIQKQFSIQFLIN